MKKMNGINKDALMGISTEMTKHKMKVNKNYASDNVEHEDDSNEQKSGGTSKIRDDDDITGVGHKDKEKGKGLKRKRC
jgi:hypothetical protein